MKVEFFKHNLGKEEKEGLNKVVDSTFITTGPGTKMFEEKSGKIFNIDRYFQILENSSITNLLVKNILILNVKV